MSRPLTASIRVADQVWLIVARLHQERPEREDFSVEEIMARAREDAISNPIRRSFHVHVTQHCVANRPPNPGRWRMLIETGPARRRLFRPGDSYDPAREGARSCPEASRIPSEYQDLLTWYRQVYCRVSRGPGADPLLSLRGSGRTLWADEPGDAYVERLRTGWV